MAEYIVMPKLGFDMREGVLVSWLKQVGESVDKGDVIAEIESDKATLELESQAGGTLLSFLANEGDVVPIGGNLAIVGQEGEDVSTRVEASDTPEPDIETTSEAEEAAPEIADGPTESSTGIEFPDGVKATPVARRLAKDKGIDLRLVQGSGPNGRIRKSDVENYKEGIGQAPVAQPVSMPTGLSSTSVATSRLRQAIGRRMVESKTTVPHFQVTVEVDMGPALALRKEINALIPPEEKVTVNDMIIKGAALALREFPNINASFGGEQLIRHGQINVGTAVAVEGGLLTVVQKNTDHTSLAQIAIDNKAMIARARDGKSRPADFEDGTFTVSNLGAFDVAHFVAIINPPNAAILAVGSARQIPVVLDGELAIGWRMQATISADHRVTDGAEAAQYMQQFKEILEEPLRLLL